MKLYTQKYMSYNANLVYKKIYIIHKLRVTI